MGRNIISFELREGKDDDIAKGLKLAISAKENQSEIIREALRFYLGREIQNSSYPKTEHMERVFNTPEAPIIELKKS